MAKSQLIYKCITIVQAGIILRVLILPIFGWVHSWRICMICMQRGEAVADRVIVTVLKPTQSGYRKAKCNRVTNLPIKMYYVRGLDMRRAVLVSDDWAKSLVYLMQLFAPL